MPDVDLSPAAVDAIARRVVELLRDQASAAGLVDASEIARRLGMSRGYVYEHATALGGHKIGGRWRFDLEVAARAHRGQEASAVETPADRPRQRQRRSEQAITASGVPLLPIGR